MSKHKLNIHYRGSPWGSRTQQHAYCLRYAHSQHIESHLGKKQPQAKIPIAFLVSQLHFNNVTSHALFYGGHLVMRSKRGAVQNQGITLNDKSPNLHKKAKPWRNLVVVATGHHRANGLFQWHQCLKCKWQEFVVIICFSFLDMCKICIRNFNSPKNLPNLLSLHKNTQICLQRCLPHCMTKLRSMM